MRPAFDQPGKILGLKDGELQAYFDSDGAIKWASGKGVADATGISHVEDANTYFKVAPSEVSLLTIYNRGTSAFNNGMSIDAITNGLVINITGDYGIGIASTSTGAWSYGAICEGTVGVLGSSNLIGGIGVIANATSPALIALQITGETTGTVNNATTNAVDTILALGHNSTGTPAAGFGGALALKLESTTTAAQDAAQIAVLWNDATHATRKADLVLSAYDTAVREGLRIRGAGSAAAIGFLGATPAARQAHIADATDAATVITRVNAVIAALETFGLLATS